MWTLLFSSGKFASSPCNAQQYLSGPKESILGLYPQIPPPSSQQRKSSFSSGANGRGGQWHKWVNEWGHSCYNGLQKYLSQEPGSQELGKDFTATKAKSQGKTYSSWVASDTRAPEWGLPAVGQEPISKATESCFMKVNRIYLYINNYYLKCFFYYYLWVHPLC